MATAAIALRETDGQVQVLLTGEWTLISLRPRHRHGPVRRAAAAHGARVLAVSPYELLALDAGGFAGNRVSFQSAGGTNTQ